MALHRRLREALGVSPPAADQDAVALPATDDDVVPDDQVERGPTAVPADHELLERAFAARAALDLGVLMRQKWKCVGDADRAFAVHRRSSPSDQPRKLEVLSSGDVAASVAEVAAVLHAASTKAFEARMRALHGKAFIFGSVERTVTTERRRVLGGGKRDPQPHVAVKTSSFVGAELLAKKEQWCFLELFLRHRRENAEGGGVALDGGEVAAGEGSGDGFTLSMSSLPPHEPLKGRLPASRVRQLHNLTASYFVHKLGPDLRAGVRVHFYSAIDGAEAAGGAVGRKGSARLQMLAKGASKLPELIQRRRLGLQVGANTAAFGARNAHCTCCTRRLLALVTRKTRCYLCGWYVCEPCSLQESLEMCNGRLATIIVCRRCLDGVNACNYSELEPSDDDELYAPCVVPDAPSTISGSTASGSYSRHSAALRYSTTPSCSTATVSTLEPTLPDACVSPWSEHASPEPHEGIEQEPTALFAGSGSSKLLVRLLASEMASDQSSASRRAAATSILGHLLDASPAPTTTSGAAVTSVSIQRSIDRTRQTRAALASLVDKALDVSAFPADVAACELANARERAYPLVVARSAAETDAVSYPVPENEAARLEAIARLGIGQLGAVEELNTLCALAAAEMRCQHGVVTLIERETVRILAANAPDKWDIGCHNARAQTFCQHFVMDERPLVVRHPEADVRFYSLNPVVQKGVRFYAGFPVRAADGTVVGALCCLDAQAPSMSRSQYWRLTKLAEAASRVLQRQSELALLSVAAGKGA